MPNARDWDCVLGEHIEVAQQMRDAAPVLDAIADAMIRCLRAGNRMYVFGNGGSAADAQHIAGELLGRFKLERRALPVMALTTDSSSLTAIANDLDFTQVFARQLEGLLQAGDVVWAISTSGNSPNVLAAIRFARARQAVVIGFAGRSGAQMTDGCDHLFRVPHDASDRIQEGHELAYHYLCERVEAALAG
jgi:D-sedoheptulose 7-phosphate isomerase